MEAIQSSYIYSLYLRLCAWLSRQWDGSAVVNWFTGQEAGPDHGPGERLLQGYQGLFDRLRLSRLLSGSVFLHPAVFAGAALVLSPLLPTMASLALVCAGFFSLALRAGTDRSFSAGISPIHKYIALFALVYAYATATSTTVQGSLFHSLLTILFVLFPVVLAGLSLSRRQIHLLLGAMVASGVVVALYGFYQLMNPEQFRSVWTDTDMFSAINFRVYSTLENPNVLGEYFLLIIPLTAAMALSVPGIPRKLPYLVAMGILGVCLVVTYSRGCYLGLLFAAAVFLVLLDRRFLIVGLVALVLSPLYLPESVLSRFTSIGDMGDTSTSYRVYIWLGTLAMLKDYWFTGIGPGSAAFNTVYPAYAYNAITAPHSHNLFLQITCDTGICGLVVFLLLLLGYYRMMFTAIAREGDRTARLLQIGAVSAVSGFLVESMTDYTFYNYRVLLLFWSVLGLSILFCRMGTPREGSHD